MADSARAAVGNRLRLRSILGWFVLAAFLFWFFDESAVQLGMALATSTILGLSEVLAEVYDLRSEIESLGLALVTLLGGLALVASGDSAGVAVPLVLAGGWMVLDAGQVLRHEGLTNDESDDRDGHAVYHEYVVRQVDETLREQPMTRRELSDTLDADNAAIDRALDTLAERGLLSRKGSELQVSSPPQAGPLGRVRDGIATALGRFARPLTIEFENDTADEPRIERGRSEPAADRECEPARGR
jgi:hypothetical protein